MPSPRYIQTQDPFSQTIRSFSEAFQPAYFERRESEREGDVLSQILAESRDDPEAALMRAMSSGLPDRSRTNIANTISAIQNIKQQKKQEAERTKSLEGKKKLAFSAAKNMGLINKDAPYESFDLDPETVLKMEMERYKQEVKPPAKKAPTAIEKQRDKIAQEITSYAPKVKQSRAILNRLRELAPKQSGLSGYYKWATGSPESSEFQALGLAAIEPVLKIFNPVGAIPQQKIELIKSIYAPKPTDLAGTIEGKLNALELFVKQAEEKLNHYEELAKQYGNNIPYEELIKIQEEGNVLVDQMISQGSAFGGGQSAQIAQTKQTFENLPPAKDFTNRIIKNPETGERMKSDGKSWVKVD